MSPLERAHQSGVTNLPTSPSSVIRQALATVVHTSSELIVLADSKRVILYANKALVDKTGRAPEELLGAKLSTLFPNKVRTRFMGSISRGLSSSMEWAGELELQRADGASVWVGARIRTMPKKGEGGGGLILTAVDLAERRMLGQQSWSRDEQLHGVIDAMTDGLYVADRRGKIVMCNRAFVAITGYKKEDVVGCAFPYPWLPAAAKVKVREVFKILRKETSLENVELECHQRNHSRRSLSFSFAVIPPASGHEEHHVTTVRDITTLDRVERLKRADERIALLGSELRRKGDILQVLVKIHSLVLKNVPVTKIFEHVIEGVKRIVEHDLAGIYLYNGDTGNFHPHTLSKQTTFARKLAKFPLRVGEGIIGSAVWSGEMVLVNNAQMDPRSRYPPGMKPPLEHFVAVPLKSKDAIFGVLVVSRNRRPEFIEEEAQLVKSFADAVVVALESIRLFSQLVHHAPGKGSRLAAIAFAPPG